MAKDPLLMVHALTFDLKKSVQKHILELWRESGGDEKIVSKHPALSDKQLTIIRKRYDFWSIPQNTDILHNRYSYITIQDPLYPALLREIADPPLILFYDGNIECLSQETFAIVGSRACTDYGIRVTKWLGGQLAHYFTIVSGLAKGIDAAAHRVAIENDRPTIAVIGTSLENRYPKENESLYNLICETGALVTEVPPLTSTQPFYFLLRNRIISGMTRGVLVTECGIKSGALNTAHSALDQNREVFTVPGSIFSKSSTGTNQLLKLGAKCVSDSNDIFQELNIDSVKVKATGANRTGSKTTRSIMNLPDDLSSEDKLIMSQLAERPLHVDEITMKSGLPISKVLQLLTILEIKRLVIQNPTQHYVRA